MNVAVVIFADIDGVLSTEAAASFADDLTAFDALAPRVAVVLCSGRTRPEIEHLSQGLRLRHPFICEHGAAAFVPDGYFPFEVPNSNQVGAYQVVEFGRPAASVIELLRRTAERQGTPIRCFSGMSVDEVAHDCGMSLPSARLAKLRDYGELFRVEDPSLDARLRFLDALRAAHLRCIPGARYDHVGASVDISIGVGLLRTLYRRAQGLAITIGVADWQSDGDVLQLVECPIAVETAANPLPRLGKRAIPPRVVTVGEGVNWAEAAATLIREQYPSLQPVAGSR